MEAFENGSLSTAADQRELMQARTTSAPIAKAVALELYFPPEILTPEQKVIFALANSGGDQCFCNLLLLTGLSEGDLIVVVRELKSKGRLVVRELPTVDGEELRLTRVALL